MNFFYANSKYENWDACQKYNIFGVRKNYVDINNGDIILLRITGHSRNPYGVKAVWKAIDILPVREDTFIPWEDGPYRWIVQCDPLVEFEHPFSEEFATKHKKSQKVDGLYASGVMGSLGKLNDEKMLGYLKGILSERTEELLSFSNEESGNAYKTLKRIFDNLEGVTLIQDEPDENYAIDLDDEEFPEGKILTRLHKYKERHSEAAKKKKARILAEEGILVCEACGFDFQKTYGQLGNGFAECHHLIPVSTLEPGYHTRFEDLAIVCSNCHSMLHRSRPLLSVIELRNLIRTIRESW
jgi:predicted HNH restriction endonuclease